MTQFVIGALGLVLLALVWFLPLLRRGAAGQVTRRDAANLEIYRQHRSELEAAADSGELDAAELERLQTELGRELLDDLQAAPEAAATANRSLGRMPLLCGFVLLPVLAFALYALLGAPAALSPAPPAAQSAAAPAQIEAMIEQLATRLQQNPDDAQGWLLLARSYQATGRPAQAALAMEKALEVAPENLDVKARYAEFLAAQNGGALAGRPAALIDQILQVQPDHPMGLWMAGLAAAQAGRTAEAVAHWQRLMAQIPQEEPAHGQIRQAIAELQGRPQAAAETAPAASDEQPAGTALKVHVTLAEALRAKTSPGEVVYVYARPVEGSRIPLAVVKKQVSDLPADIVLTDAMAMTPQARLSDHSEVIVGARVSKQGTALPAAGDLEGSKRVKVRSAERVTVEIGQVLP